MSHQKAQNQITLMLYIWESCNSALMLLAQMVLQCSLMLPISCFLVAYFMCLEVLKGDYTFDDDCDYTFDGVGTDGVGQGGQSVFLLIYPFHFHHNHRIICSWIQLIWLDNMAYK